MTKSGTCGNIEKHKLPNNTNHKKHKNTKHKKNTKNINIRFMETQHTYTHLHTHTHTCTHTTAHTPDCLAFLLKLLKHLTAEAFNGSLAMAAAGHKRLIRNS